MPGRRRASVVVCGLGAAAPGTATLESLRLLRSCAVVVSDLGAPVRSRLAKLLGRPCRAAKAADAPRLVAQARAGRKVGCATAGHPLSFGPLGEALRARAKAERIRCVFPTGGASLLDAALSLTRQA